MKLFTHKNVDLDAVCSVWAARKFIQGAEQAELEFVSANWDGSDMDVGKGDMALDVEAGGKGIKGYIDPGKRVYSCFAYLVQKFAPKEDQRILKYLVMFVDVQDSRGNALRYFFPNLKTKERIILASISLNTIFAGLQTFFCGEDLIIVDRMSEILSGLLELGQGRIRAIQEIKHAKFFGGGIVALIIDGREPGTMNELLSRGVRAVVYKSGNNIGVKRENSIKIRMDHPDIRSVVEEVGEIDEWFSHESGFLFCRGSRKSAAETESKVDPYKFAQAVANVLQTLPKEEITEPIEDSEE